MIADHLTGIEKSDADLWKIVDGLRGDSRLASKEYFTRSTELRFLLHATNHDDEAQAALETRQATGKMPKRPLVKAGFVKHWQYGEQPDEAVARIAGICDSRQVEP